MGLLPNWLKSMATRRTAPLPVDDLADMGTAYGLDASMAPPAERAAESVAVPFRMGAPTRPGQGSGPSGPWRR